MDNAGIVYRKAGSEDMELLVAYRLTFLKELQGVPTQEVEARTKEELTEYYRRGLTDSSCVAWLAESGGKVVSLGVMVVHEIPANFKTINGRKGYILNMYTVPEFRKRGLAAQILECLISEGKKMGLGKIYLHAVPAGMEIYRRRGFISSHSPELEMVFPFDS